MKWLLETPELYHFFQNVGGFFGARVTCIDDYLDLHTGDRIIDIGCGPGYILDHLPSGVDYLGFDTDARYIAYARRHFGHKGSFYCRPFDAACAEEHGPADVAMMNGVIHHLDDAGAAQILRAIGTALKPNGILFTLDGCFREGQSSVAKWLLRNDRGAHVRTEQGYRDLSRAAFQDVTIFVREDVSRVPYTFAIGLSRRPFPLPTQ